MRRTAGWRVAVVGLALGALAAGMTAASGAIPPRWDVRALPSGSSFSEPGLAAGPHGRLLANACTANAGGPATFWSSADNGGTWSHGFEIDSSPIGCGDADTAIGSDGYEYALTLGAGIDVYRSRDGRAWSGPASFPPPHGEDQPDRPWLVTIPGRPADVLLFNSEIGGNIVEWTSRDHGASFTGPVAVTGGVNSQAALTLGSRPLVDPGDPDRMQLFYETASMGGVEPAVGADGPDQFPLSQLWQARSDDGGKTWSSILVLDVTTAFGAATGTLGHLLPATAVDRAGNTYVVLSVQLGTSQATHLYFMHSTPSGWSAPVAVEHGLPSNVFPALAVGAPGELFISWYASDASSFTDTTARWTELVASTASGLTAHPRFGTTTLSGRVPVHVGAIDAAGAVGNDLGQNWALRDFQSASVDSAGRPHLTWATDYPSPRTYTAFLRR